MGARRDGNDLENFSWKVYPQHHYYANRPYGLSSKLTWLGKLSMRRATIISLFCRFVMNLNKCRYLNPRTDRCFPADGKPYYYSQDLIALSFLVFLRYPNEKGFIRKLMAKAHLQNSIWMLPWTDFYRSFDLEQWYDSHLRGKHTKYQRTSYKRQAHSIEYRQQTLWFGQLRKPYFQPL